MGKNLDIRNKDTEFLFEYLMEGAPSFLIKNTLNGYDTFHVVDEDGWLLFDVSRDPAEENREYAGDSSEFTLNRRLLEEEWNEIKHLFKKTGESIPVWDLEKEVSERPNWMGVYYVCDPMAELWAFRY